MIREQDQASTRCLTQKQIKNLINQCDFLTHIVMPYEADAMLEHANTKNLCQQQNIQIQKQGQQLKIVLAHILDFQNVLICKNGHFIKICVQLFYLIYACLSSNILLQFHKECFVYSGSKGKFMVVVRNAQQLQSNQKIPTKTYFNQYIKLITFLTSVISQTQSTLQQKTTSLQQKLPLEQLSSTIQKINENENNSVLKNLLQKMEAYIEQLQKINKVIQVDFQCFKAIQKYQLISQNSILRKMTHKSINLCLFKFGSKQAEGMLGAAIKMEVKYTRLYNQVKGSSMHNQEKLSQIYAVITDNFEKYLQNNWTQNPSYIKLTQPRSEQKNQFNDSKPMLFRVKFKPRTQASNHDLKHQKQKPKQNFMDYTIQYYNNAQFPSLVVRLHTPIILQPASMDQTMFKLNTYIFGSNFASIQIGQKFQSQIQKKTKYIILKTISKLIRGSSVLKHFLRLIDMLMCVYQVIEHEACLPRENSGFKFKEKELSCSNQEIIQEIEHYLEIVNDIAENFYRKAAESV